MTRTMPKLAYLLQTSSPHHRRTCDPLRIINTLTPKPAVTSHATSILVGQISAGCCSRKGGEGSWGVVIKGTLRGEMRGMSFISPTTRSEEKTGNWAGESIPRVN
ncbi:hypothetical protein AVEN_231369-1 [Araneus ventricosus]|uniref:Uncharacterized protein n=1 Tax=Araneus ventricosus TaxID=182803 RepID=A0A4Y2LQN6_ARAVE|nr:hypothetical protein AVEN_231369-1 [Araneus ventricosus]